MYNLVKIFLVCCLLAGCAASGKQTISTASKVAADKIIAMNIDSGGPWMKEIEIRLKQSGFRVLRAASVNEAIEVFEAKKSTKNRSKGTARLQHTVTN